MDISTYEKAYNRSIGRKQVLTEQNTSLTSSIESLTKRLGYIEQAQALIQKVAQETQEQLTFQIEDVVNTALSTCFPDEYKFHMNIEIKRNNTEASLILTKNGVDVNPMEAVGGGVVDVVSMGLRIASWSLSNTNNVLIIDEGFKFLSRDLQPKMADILQEISEKLDVQFIQVSHSPDIIEKSDRVFTVALQDGISRIKEGN